MKSGILPVKIFCEKNILLAIMVLSNIVVNIEEILNIYFKGTGSIKYIDNP